MRRVLLATVLMAPLALTASVFAAPPAAPNATTEQKAELSTAVLPRLIHQEPVIVSERKLSFVRPGYKFVVDVNIDAKGVPTAVNVVNSPLAEVNEEITEAVLNYRWTPGTLHNQAVPSTSKLVIQIQ